MSVQDPHIDERLRAAAMRQFLEHGYLEANLQEICAEAGVTTGALYKRYQGKEALFCALVDDVYVDLQRFVEQHLAIDVSGFSDQELVESWNTHDTSGLEWMRLFWDYGDPFKLIVRGAAGTRYANFHHDFLTQMAEVDYRYLVEAQRRGLARTDIDEIELHVLLTAQWEAYYEPFVHDFTWEQIERHVEIVSKLFDWQYALGMRDRPPR